MIRGGRWQARASRGFAGPVVLFTSAEKQPVEIVKSQQERALGGDHRKIQFHAFNQRSSHAGAFFFLHSLLEWTSCLTALKARSQPGLSLDASPWEGAEGDIYGFGCDGGL